jgi:hypothetical protein
MGSWLEVRCPMCGWLHHMKKWSKMDPFDESESYGLQRFSDGKSLESLPLKILDDAQLESIYAKLIAPRSLFLAGIFYRDKLIFSGDVQREFKDLFDETRHFAKISFVSKPSLLNFGKRYLRDYSDGGDLKL